MRAHDRYARVRSSQSAHYSATVFVGARAQRPDDHDSIKFVVGR